MDNREFAQVLLCEATSLLEGAQKEAYIKRKLEEKHNQEVKDLEGVMARSFRKYEDLADTAHKTKGKKFYNNYVKKYEDKLDSLPDATANDRVAAAHAGLSALKRAEKEAKKDGFDYRKKSRKPQNESIAILLTEAALLLNEAVGVRDKSTGKVVKTFKTNEEATNWIINNGGNDRYQLTNQLK